MTIEDRWSFNGLKVIYLRSDYLEISMIPELGGVINSIRRVLDNMEILAQVRDPIPLSRLQGLYPAKNLLDIILIGGWYEILPNAGYFSSYEGADYGLHEESVYLPWKAMYDDFIDPNSVTLQVSLTKSPISLSKHITLQGGQLTIQENLVNTSDQDINIAWLHHPIFGGDLLDENTELLIDRCEFEVDKYLPNDKGTLKPGYKGIWPMCIDKQDRVVNLSKIPKRGEINSDDSIYIPNLPSGTFTIQNIPKKMKVVVNWDNKLFPVLWIWRAFGGGRSFPSYGSIYAMGVEMGTSYPSTGLAQQSEMGTLYRMKGNSEIKTTIEFKVEPL